MKKFLIVLLFAALIFTACAPAATLETPAAEPTSTPHPTATMAPTDPPTEAPTVAPTAAPTATREPTKVIIDPASNFPTGDFLNPEVEGDYFRFTKNGGWSHGGGASGRFRVEGDTYFQESLSPNPQKCPPMSFTFTFDGTNLTFQLNEQSKKDPCSDRKGLYDNKTYILDK